MNFPLIDFRPSNKNTALIEIISLDSLYLRRNSLGHDSQKPHILGFSMLLFVQQQSGSHFVDFAKYRFEAGTLIFVNKNQLNAFDLSNRPQGFAVLFTDELVEGVQQNMRSPIFSPGYFKAGYSPVLQASSALQKSCEMLLTEIQSEQGKATSDALIVMHLFSALFLLIDRERGLTSGDSTSKQQHQKFSRFVDLLEKQLVLSRNASDYAGQLGLSYKALNLVCKLSAGLTAKQMIDAFTILEAKRRLVVDKMPVQNIAIDLGFDEVSNFTKYFKKHTGAPPSHFQKKRQ